MSPSYTSNTSWRIYLHYTAAGLIIFNNKKKKWQDFDVFTSNLFHSGSDWLCYLFFHPWCLVHRPILDVVFRYKDLCSCLVRRQATCVCVISSFEDRGRQNERLMEERLFQNNRKWNCVKCNYKLIKSLYQFYPILKTAAVEEEEEEEEITCEGCEVIRRWLSSSGQ